MLKFGNKEFRNLQEQVKKNMDDISFILQEEGVLNEFGIKVVGQEASVIDMPTVDDYKEDNPEWSYGDAFAIGTEEPYELYILTRANGTHPNDYWFNIGEFPAPGPQGPEGPQGEVGPQGPTGNPGADGVSPQLGVGNVVVETLESDQDATVAITESGTQAYPIWNFNFGIPKGQDGSAITAVEWGQISGTLSAQTDLLSALQAKANASSLASYATQVYANNVASNATYQANVYTDSKISALSSVYMTETALGDYLYDNEYAHIDEIPTDTSDLTNNAGFITNTALSGYATQSWVSSNFLSIGTPVGGSAVWGSISGTLSNQTDLMNKFSEYATVSSLSSAISGVNSTISSLDYLSVGALSSATVIPDITGLASEGYVNTQIANLSSVYAPIGDYATTSDLSSAISGLSSVYASISALSDYATISAVSSAISALDYASVGALSSETYIPRVGGDNDGTYWTAITLGDDTFSIPQGGISSIAWGDITGSLEDQSDLQTALDEKVNKEVTVGDDSSFIDINETVIGLYVDGLGENDESVGSYLETSKDGVVIQANNEAGQATQLIVENNAINIYRDSDASSIDLFDLTTTSALSSAIDSLSSVYQPIGSYVSQADLSGYASQADIDALSSVYASQSALSLYAELSASNIFTGLNSFRSTIYARNIYPSANNYTLGSSTKRWLNIYVNNLYGSDNVSKPVSQIALLSDISSAFSGYAELSASNTFTSDNYFNSSVFLSTNSYGACYMYASFSGLASAGTYIITGSPTGGSATKFGVETVGSSHYINFQNDRYASEVWTFTLSDDTTVTKTVLVG